MTSNNAFQASTKNKICCSNNKSINQGNISVNDKMCSLGIMRSSAKEEIQNRFLAENQQKLDEILLKKEEELKNIYQIKTKIVSIVNEAKQLNINYELSQDGIILLSYLNVAFKDKWAVYVYNDNIQLYHKNQKGNISAYHLQREYAYDDIDRMLKYVINHKHISFTRNIMNRDTVS